MATKTAALILNGECFIGAIKDDFIVCADGGYNMCTKIGIKPDVIVGDLDSIIEHDESIETVRFSTHKDQTDGELALRYIANRGFRTINIYGADGGRLDHIMGNIGLMYQAANMGIKAVIKTNYSDMYFARSNFQLETCVGDIISVVPYSDNVHIMNTEGLEYPVINGDLEKGATIGISNVAIDRNIRINIDQGEALIFRIFQ